MKTFEDYSEELKFKAQKKRKKISDRCENIYTSQSCKKILFISHLTI